MAAKKISSDRKRSRSVIKRNKLSILKKNKLGIGIISVVIIIGAIVGIYFVYTEIGGSDEDGISDNTIDNGSNSDNGGDGEDFTFKTLEGKEKKLSDYRGKIVVLDLWATWCSPCQGQMLELRKIYQHYSKDELQILSIDIDSRETVDQIKDFKQQFAYYGYSLDWTFGLEKDSLDKYMPEAGIPTLAIFNQQGNLKYRHAGLSYFNEIPENYPTDQPEPPLLKEKIDELF